jgi:NAD(P)-dependent dehydrogenase (short-subunit alcohol dehydrogenase family)
MQTVLITGGTGGLGTHVVARLSRDYRCVVLARGATPEGVESVHGDLADDASIRAAFASTAPFYGLVHLAGGFAMGSVADTSSDTWSQMLALNVTAAFTAAREALPHLTRPGRIVMVSSEATLAPSAGIAAYTVSKSALNTLVEVLAVENRDLTVNAVLPAAMATPAMLASGMTGLVPLERVSETIAFLLSDAAAGISGARIPIRA